MGKGGDEGVGILGEEKRTPFPPAWPAIFLFGYFGRKGHGRGEVKERALVSFLTRGIPPQNTGSLYTISSTHHHHHHPVVASSPLLVPPGKHKPRTTWNFNFELWYPRLT